MYLAFSFVSFLCFYSLFVVFWWAKGAGRKPTNRSRLWEQLLFFPCYVFQVSLWKIISGYQVTVNCTAEVALQQYSSTLVVTSLSTAECSSFLPKYIVRGGQTELQRICIMTWGFTLSVFRKMLKFSKLSFLYLKNRNDDITVLGGLN